MTQYITTLFTTHPPAHPPLQLVIEVVQQLQRMFLPDVKIIKKSIENLIDVSRARPEWATVLCLSNGRYLRKLEWLPAIACFVDTSRAGPPRRTCAACC